MGCLKSITFDTLIRNKKEVKSKLIFEQSRLNNVLQSQIVCQLVGLWSQSLELSWFLLPWDTSTKLLLWYCKKICIAVRHFLFSSLLCNSSVSNTFLKHSFFIYCSIQLTDFTFKWHFSISYKYLLASTISFQ